MKVGSRVNDEVYSGNKRITVNDVTRFVREITHKNQNEIIRDICHFAE